MNFSEADELLQLAAARQQAIESESQELELDLSSLGAVNTMFAALFSKLGVPIKTTMSATVLEEALNDMVTVRPLLLGQPVTTKDGVHYMVYTPSDPLLSLFTFSWCSL
ncbi:hypothetical protein ABKV19_003943 [Rosa sericea]